MANPIGVLLLVSNLVASRLVLAADETVCHALDGSPQQCEDYTYAGSLVSGDLSPEEQLEEQVAVEKLLKSIPPPENASLEKCGERLQNWLGVVFEYYRTDVYDAGEIVPTQNYVMVGWGGKRN